MNTTNIAILLFGFVVWLLHFLPICDGIQKWCKLDIVISSACAAIISIIPFISILAAISGASYSWQIKPWKSIISFVILWCIILGVAIIIKAKEANEANEANNTITNNQLRNALTTRQINNHLSTSLLHKQLIDLANEVNEKLPITNEIIRTHSTQAINSELHHNYTLIAYNAIKTNNLFQKEKNSVIDRVQHSVYTAHQDTKELLNQGVSLIYNYFRNDDKKADTTKIIASDC